MEGAGKPPNPTLPCREDCWSEEETSALIEAWGDRYVELSRGNLRQQHWQEVAAAVNSRRRYGGEGARRPPRTDVQCKNRIDTLKKKYKVERARVLESGVPAESQWTFYCRLDALIGSSVTPSSASASVKKPSPSPPLAVPLPFRCKASPLPAAAAVDLKRPRMVLPVNDSIYRRAAAAAAAAAEEDDNESESASSLRSSSTERSQKVRREGEGIRELARAIERFGEIYERVEAAKQQHMMELEKQRIEFAKELEFERMRIFVDTQIQLAKLKRTKRADADSYL